MSRTDNIYALVDTGFLDIEKNLSIQHIYFLQGLK